MLSLGDNDLTGTIPAALGRLANLTHLNLVDNQLSGQIPAELGNLTKLEQLYLGNKGLTGDIPTWLGNLTQLDSLLLSRTQLTGDIPVELGTLTKLKQLYLSHNQLTGTIPAWLVKLTKLEQLGLSSNRLTGPIPAELGALTNLTFLDLSSNQLTGTIPVALGNLTNVDDLLLSSNQLTGTIPVALGRLTNLGVLSLGDNQLTGAIPAELGQLTNLAILILADNDLSGTIPMALDNLVPPAGRLYRVRIATGNPGLCGPIPPALQALSPAPPDVVNDLGSDSYPTGSLGSCPSVTPATPALTATVREGAVELSWDAVTGATRYELMTWWDAESGWQPLGGDKLTGSSYRHTTVTPGTTYYYTVRTVSATGEASAWLVDYPTATVTALLAAPALTAEATPDGIFLSWERAPDATGYQLMTWWDAEAGWQPVGEGNLTGTGYTHTEVTAGTIYYYTIRAVFADNRTSGWLQPYPNAEGRGESEEERGAAG